jgi:hypothetical protein
MVAKPNPKMRKLLSDVPEQYVFWCHDGNVLHNMRELAEELTIMSAGDYAFHANTERNDFATWVKDIIKDETLAKNLRKAINQEQAASIVSSRIESISTKRK